MSIDFFTKMQQEKGLITEKTGEHTTDVNSIRENGSQVIIEPPVVKITSTQPNYQERPNTTG